MTRPLFLFLCLFLTALCLLPVFAARPGTAQDAHPGFDGIWNSATTTPLERPLQLREKPFFTPEEAAEWERQFAERNQEPSPGAVSRNAGTGTYNTFYREFGIAHGQDPPHLDRDRSSRWPHSRPHAGRPPPSSAAASKR